MYFVQTFDRLNADTVMEEEQEKAVEFNSSDGGIFFASRLLIV